MSKVLAAGIVLSVVLAPLCAGANVVRVPDDYLIVAEALNSASAYDTVMVAPGTYPLNTTWPDKPGVKLMSEEGPASTILDGGHKDVVIWIDTPVDTTTVISGFTIRNGFADGV